VGFDIQVKKYMKIVEAQIGQKKQGCTWDFFGGGCLLESREKCKLIIS
jgi:hypothetical protein